MRMPRTYINDLLYHKGAVNQLEWSPSSEYQLLSSGSDGEVFIWDQSKCGEEQARHDYNEGPPEMIFSHEYHRKNNIEDIGWSPFVGEDDNLAVSIDTQLMMQVWKISEDFMFDEIAFLDRLDMVKDSDLE
jgi:histone-binding protein RBBP4